MTSESALWFSAQVVAINLAALVGYRVANCGTRAWRWTALGATLLMLGWPLMRLFPAHVVHWFGVAPVIFIEVTGIVVPAVLLFTIAARNIRATGERRAVALLIPVCCLYFLRNGVWMVRPPIDDLGQTRMVEGVCLQSTDYTCVAASMVTMLERYGYHASETEMARLSFTEPGWGTTDSRALGALSQYLAGRPVEIAYEVMDYQRLMAVPKPCLVTVKWGYFVSHMVPVLSADRESVQMGDPSCGIQVRTPEEFQEIWQRRGIYLIDRRDRPRAPM